MSGIRPLAGVLFLLAAGTSARAVDGPIRVAKWSTYELSFQAIGSYANPYTSGPELTGTFSGPGGVSKTVSGFWDGGDTFKIRFTPTAEGSWAYKTHSSDRGLDNKSGAIDCGKPEAASRGFLRIDPQHRTSFVWDDGTRYFMMGQTYYDIVKKGVWAADDPAKWHSVSEAIDKSVDYRMNKIRLNVYPCNDYPVHDERNDYPDVQPYNVSSGKIDRDSLNVAYWRTLDRLVQYMGSKGVVADLIVTQPYDKNRMFGTEAQNDRFVRYVVSRYSAYANVIWCMSNEWEKSSRKKAGVYVYPNPQKGDDLSRMGSLVRNGDPWMSQGAALRPLSIHNMSYEFQFYKESWPTHVAIQYTGDGKEHKLPDDWGNWGIRFNLEAGRRSGAVVPVVNDEYGYINGKYGAMTQIRSRQVIWSVVTAGGYGSIGDFRRTPTGGMGEPEVTGDWYDTDSGSNHGGEYGDIKRLVEFFASKRIEYWKMTSHNELLKTANRTYLLAEPCREYVAYAADGGSFSIDLAAGNYDVLRYDPQTGRETRLEKVSGGAPRAFKMPDSNDWVIYLRATR